MSELPTFETEDEFYLWMSEQGYIEDWKVGESSEDDELVMNWDKLEAEQPRIFEIFHEAHVEEVQNSLVSLLEQGLLEEAIDPESNEVVYGLSAAGKKYVEDMSIDIMEDNL